MDSGETSQTVVAAEVIASTIARRECLLAVVTARRLGLKRPALTLLVDGKRVKPGLTVRMKGGAVRIVTELPTEWIDGNHHRLTVLVIADEHRDLCLAFHETEFYARAC